MLTCFQFGWRSEQEHLSSQHDEDDFEVSSRACAGAGLCYLSLLSRMREIPSLKSSSGFDKVSKGFNLSAVFCVVFRF